MFLFRADGNKKIGAGHMMRCLTIAAALRDVLRGNGGESSNQEQAILFVCADEDSAKLAEDYGFAARVLHSDYRRMEEELPLWQQVVGQNCCAQAQRIIGREPGDNECGYTILVDSYYVTPKYLQSLRSYGKVVLMDDMQREAYPVDVVVNYNAFATEEVYRKLYEGNAVKICAGSSYVPVRQQFLHRNYRVKDTVERILITTGGGDVDNIAGKILRMLLDNEKFNYDLIIGKYNPHRDSLLKLSEEYPNIQLYEDVRDMAGLMEQCDMAITAGGTTIYELAAIGVPFICFSYAENQEMLTEYIGEQQIAGYAGAYHKDASKTLECMRKLFLDMVSDNEKRNTCYLKETQMIDGMGAGRIVKDALL